jgi:hypothetical protein
MQTNAAILFFLVTLCGFTFDIVERKSQHTAVANSATALDAEGAAFTELGIAMMTVSGRVSIRVINTSHNCCLNDNEKEKEHLLS